MNPALIEFPDLLESERLVVRSPKPRDDEELHTAICETFDDLNTWMPWAEELPDISKTRKFVKNKHSAFLGRKDLVFLLSLKGTKIRDRGIGVGRSFRTKGILLNQR
ncbi:TPA: hypothetical protein EYN98_06695 [Candidatus Poribacteria bacterium]|jgi:hypothetical protein|nr:hypothetical protein [Candidatus Poribacteria bacterium]HIA65742.1 hypothetical protein [Candidatus Poribacteria bacterium]HIB88494.1 hypothetical protein [Candidatus Poribacteria bacterium]HIB88499.1 hypothetical protein [Candidatus Poribacteria bacterium]HIC02107.1 hypothetical protein [Candidatus Poribacteria bacterium]